MQTKKVIDYIVNWLNSYAKNAGVEGFVVGISGGIDSAVVSTLCAKTGLPTLCVEMPIHQAESQVSRGREHIDFLMSGYPNVQKTEIDLGSVFDEFQAQVPQDANEKSLHLSLANSRARLRMTALYFLAGIKHYLVVGTGNKIEDFGVGFFTKYGDGGVDISPIADLVKSEVFELGRVLNIPESILKAQPTDGLFGDSRSDEDQLGANYDELEWAMKEKEKGSSSSGFSGREKVVFEIYSHLNKINQHKIKPIPICEIPENLK
ncbi:NAD(+) synthase [Aequorivita sp. H23M31]|uniref:NH(3)-dependent NAD(+) synthetase n=1 Tax=Aequorivita ciconiae TaxID=2494375 RepID=A0A410G2Y7_9FLAO|nr:NAD(+) synthase [Aequorivita sp. H23M31]QAA81609.1 NAD(+) synthase [Aequorivita sp. H23M31]